MKTETVEARAVKIAAKIMQADGLCRYDDVDKCRRVSQHNPRKAPDIPVYQRRAFGFGEVLTVRREPRKPHRAAPANLSRVYIPHARLQVFRVWVVCPVH